MNRNRLNTKRIVQPQLLSFGGAEVNNKVGNKDLLNTDQKLYWKVKKQNLQKTI